MSTIFPGFIREAGMFADAGVKLPTGVGTSSPDQVARAVAKAIEKNVGEIDVAPLSVRIGAKFGGVAPGLAAAVQRRFGAGAIAEATPIHDHGRSCGR